MKHVEDLGKVLFPPRKGEKGPMGTIPLWAPGATRRLHSAWQAGRRRTPLPSPPFPTPSSGRSHCAVSAVVSLWTKASRLRGDKTSAYIRPCKPQGSPPPRDRNQTAGSGRQAPAWHSCGARQPHADAASGALSAAPASPLGSVSAGRGGGADDSCGVVSRGWRAPRPLAVMNTAARTAAEQRCREGDAAKRGPAPPHL